MSDRSIGEQIGRKAELHHVITEQDVIDFAEVTGDKNPLHMDEDYAKNTIFGKCIVHGAFGVGLVSRLIAESLPGKGSILLSQSFKYKGPMHVGDTMKVAVEVLTAKPRVLNAPAFNVMACRYGLRTSVYNQKGELIIDGEAEVLK